MNPLDPIVHELTRRAVHDERVPMREICEAARQEDKVRAFMQLAAQYGLLKPGTQGAT